jgi:hypothetical protein
MSRAPATCPGFGILSPLLAGQIYSGFRPFGTRVSSRLAAALLRPLAAPLALLSHMLINGFFSDIRSVTSASLLFAECVAQCTEPGFGSLLRAVLGPSPIQVCKWR